MVLARPSLAAELTATNASPLFITPVVVMMMMMMMMMMMLMMMMRMMMVENTGRVNRAFIPLKASTL